MNVVTGERLTQRVHDRREEVGVAIHLTDIPDHESGEAGQRLRLLDVAGRECGPFYIRFPVRRADGGRRTGDPYEDPRACLRRPFRMPDAQAGFKAVGGPQIADRVVVELDEDEVQSRGPGPVQDSIKVPVGEWTLRRRRQVESPVSHCRSIVHERS